ncbi:MAG: molybdate ABC transporter permease subunit [Coriobacteriia bacterium]|nr:molybdate ABC transporter permease subunit [Coriobacteriia bacterium]
MDFASIAFPLRLSLQVAGISTVLVALLGVPLAYVLATRDFRGKAAAGVAVMLPMVLPPIVTGYYLLLLVGRNGLLGRASRALTGTAVGLTFTWQAAVIASFVIALPLGVTTARSAIAAVDPAHADASRTLGRGELETAIYVVLPLAARGIVAGLALAFARALGEFGATIMVAGNIPGQTNTMALEVYNAVIYGDWKTATLLVVVFTAVSAAVLLGAGRLSAEAVR